MGFLTKTLVKATNGRKGNGGSRKPATDFTLTKSEQGNAVREIFTVSKTKFAELGLTGLAAAFTDQPLTLVTVSEQSELATSLHAKREGTSEKSRGFANPQLVDTLVATGVIPAERKSGFKANFTLTKADEATVANVKEQAGEQANDIVDVYALTVSEITEFTPRPRGPRTSKAKQMDLFDDANQTNVPQKPEEAPYTPEDDEAELEPVDNFTGEDDDIDVDA